MRFNFHNWFSEVEVKGSTSIKRAYTKKPQLSLDQKLVCTKMEGYSKVHFYSIERLISPTRASGNWNKQKNKKTTTTTKKKFFKNRFKNQRIIMFLLLNREVLQNSKD